jgi:hypothetical protein
VGSTRTISATPNAGFSFTAWNDGNTSANRQVVVPAGGATYTAQFSSVSAQPDIDVIGRGVSMVAGDSTPSVADDTDFGLAVVVAGSVRRTFTIRNVGGAALVLGGTPLVAKSGPHTADFVVAQPTATTLASGQTVTFEVVFTPTAGGNRSAVLSISSNDADTPTFAFSIAGAGTVASAAHSRVGSGYQAQSTITVSNTFTFGDAAEALGWQVLLPSGWSFVSQSGDAGDVGPVVGATQVLEWAWTNPTAGPVNFTYTLAVPAGQSGEKQLAALAILRSGGRWAQFLVRPDPLPLLQAAWHAADTNRDFRLSLGELTRVIELYNARNGTVRTGAYVIQDGTEDGFATDPTRASGVTATLVRFHSADSDRNGSIGLNELTRVIQLYNFRVGTTRTGDYRVQAGSEDGFAPGPASADPVLPPVPVTAAATEVTTNGFRTNWTAISGINGLKLDVATDAAFTNFVAGYNNRDVNGNAAGESVTGLSPGTTYYYRLRSFLFGGATSANSVAIAVTTAGTAVPVPVVSAATEVTMTSFRAHWTAISGINGQKMDVATDAAFTSFFADHFDRDVNADNASVVVSGLTPGTTYFVRFRAILAGVTGANSAVVTVTTVPVPMPVVSAATEVTTTSFRANWTAISGINGLKLDVATDAAFTNFVAGYNNRDVNGNAASQTVTGLSPGTTYYYRLRSFLFGGATSVNSATISAVTAGAP